MSILLHLVPIYATIFFAYNKKDQMERLGRNLMMDIKIKIDNELQLDEMPDLDLYMDQVIQLFERKMADSKRNDQEKILTKTMINNYAKGKLLPEIKNKKYSQELLIYISLICQLKGVLSIHDIKKALDNIRQTDSEPFYGEYIKNVAFGYDFFKDSCEAIEQKVSRTSDPVDQVMLITQMTNMSNLYRRAAEALVDALPEVPQEKKKG